MEIKDIIESIVNLFNFELIEETETKVTFRIVSEYTAILDKQNLSDIIEKIGGLKSNENIELFDSQNYEVLVRNESRIAMRRELEQVDSVNKLEYSLNSPSDEYLVFLLFNLNKENTPNIFRRSIMGHRLKRIFGEQEEQPELFEHSLLEVIKRGLMRLETISIKSKTIRKLDEYERFLYAFIFNLGFNLDMNIQPLRFIEEFTQPYKIGRIRRARPMEVEPPKRIYINDLVLHYQKAISSDSIDHQYLSYYHVMEYFFEKIYNDDVIDTIRQELTKPNFSYKRQRDVKGLVSTIQKKLRYRNEEFSINELEALELTLKKYISDIEMFTESLDELSETLLDYYKGNEVSFCQGQKVDFKNTNKEEIYRNLAKRIYKTRNAIVHSKENEKSKYVPFKNDKDLINELYLMRLIAETLILETSKEL
ncbi:hypothetical protein LPB136_08620 [Tenacibaculum todarodis]|uniref:Apea-like HEPN domain-containing protein n=1 Tax=Tenacibaculum todarodis TaxID=1850252 RepID=A0A1L3JJZ8_9FLAO|nr:hypothetical protein [Tenacibaculum todarodis]APG65413.1 hypothetical protein LPB136_08620 [Tenacibaculum todarodis]